MNTFYEVLAEHWPLISPVEDYEAEGTEIVRMLRARAPHARSLLELGSGGGHVAFYLKRSFDCHLTDLSEAMLRQSRRLNPECVHTAGDMRSLALDRVFDLVLAHDAIDYMTTEDDLRAVFETAWRHLASGGLACFIPDALRETYEPGVDTHGSDSDDGRGVRLFEWGEAARDDRSSVTVHYSFLVRDREGRVSSYYEPHICGLFARDTWETLLRGAGFAVETVVEQTEEDRPGRVVFFARKER